MPLPRNATEAIGQRLVSDDAIKGIVRQGIYPNHPAPDTPKPYLVFFKLSGGGNSDLGGKSGLQAYNFRFEFYAETDEEAEEIRRAVLDRLCGNRKKSIAPWRDMPSGVQGCFPVDDADIDVDDAGNKVAGQTVTLWFCPQV